MCMGPNSLPCLQEGQMTLAPDEKIYTLAKGKFVVSKV